MSKKRYYLIPIYVVFLFLAINTILNLLTGLSGLFGLQFPIPDDSRDFFRYGETVVGIIASLMVVDQLRAETESEKENSLIQQSTFIKDYNESFITDPNMTDVESELERFYAAYLAAQKEDDPEQKEREIRDLEEKIGKPGSKERQKYINYLVYLESLATIIRNKALRIGNVDSLMGYRFFLAVNNPVLQKHELEPYVMHYRGIYWLYENWIIYKKTRYDQRLRETIKDINRGIIRLLLNLRTDQHTIQIKKQLNELKKILLTFKSTHVTQDQIGLLNDSIVKLEELSDAEKTNSNKNSAHSELELIIIDIKGISILMSESENGILGIPLFNKDCSLSRLGVYEPAIRKKTVCPF